MSSILQFLQKNSFDRIITNERSSDVENKYPAVIELELEDGNVNRCKVFYREVA